MTKKPAGAIGAMEGSPAKAAKTDGDADDASGKTMNYSKAAWLKKQKDCGGLAKDIRSFH